MKIVVTTSSFPMDEHDVVPTFVLDQLKTLYALDNALEIYVLIPHHGYSVQLPNRRKLDSHQEVRFHYFFPYSLEKLSGRGILPALKANPLRYGLIPFFLLGQRRALKRLCMEIQPDLIYAHWFMPQAVVAAGVARRLNIPLLFTSHASDVSILNKLPFSKLLVRRSLMTASRFSAVSQRTANKMTNFFTTVEWEQKFASKISIIPMGTNYANSERIDLPTIKELDRQRPDERVRYVLFLGRLTEKKGTNYLVDAFAQISANPSAQSTRLVIAGDGELKGKLMSRVAEADLESKVEFVGHVSGERKSTFIANAEMVIIPSIIDGQGDSEGMPVVLMEALSYGRRVIATTVSGAEEILDESSGVLIAPNNVEALAAAILGVLHQTEPERRLMEARAVQCSNQFSWNSVGRRYHTLIQEAVAHK